MQRHMTPGYANTFHKYAYTCSHISVVPQPTYMLQVGCAITSLVHRHLCFSVLFACLLLGSARGLLDMPPGKQYPCLRVMTLRSLGLGASITAA